MTEQELERALREGLRPLEADLAVAEQVMARIRPSAGLGAGTRDRAPYARPQRRWLPAAIATTALMAFGFAHWAQQQRHYQLQLRAQLLQGLTIASASLREARGAVLQNENSPP